MLVGKSVKVYDPSKLKVFYPAYKIVYQVPILSGSYIFAGQNLGWIVPGSVIYVSEKGSIDLDKVENIVALLKHFKVVTKKYEEHFLSIKDPKECWKAVEEYFWFDIISEFEKEQNVYNLFLTLHKSDVEIYQTYKKVKLPFKVIMSSLLTMLSKASSYKEYQGLVSPLYLKSLQNSYLLLRDVKKKFIEFWESGRTELDFIYLLFNLKR